MCRGKGGQGVGVQTPRSKVCKQGVTGSIPVRSIEKTRWPAKNSGWRAITFLQQQLPRSYSRAVSPVDAISSTSSPRTNAPPSPVDASAPAGLPPVSLLAHPWLTAIPPHRGHEPSQNANTPA